MLIKASDPSVHIKKKPVVLSVKYSKIPGSLDTDYKVMEVCRTNGLDTEYVYNINGSFRRIVTPCTKEDRYDYDQDKKPDDGRNDILIKACNDVYNRFFRNGYLSKRHGIRGWVRSINSVSAKIFLNTDVSGRVILALLNAWYPQYEWSII